MLFQNENARLFERLKEIVEDKNQYQGAFPISASLIVAANDIFAEKQVIAQVSNVSQSATLGNPEKAGNIYITDFVLTARGGLVASTTELIAVINGENVRIGIIAESSSGDSQTMNFTYPLKIDKIQNNITISGGDGATYKATIRGYQL